MGYSMLKSLTVQPKNLTLKYTTKESNDTSHYSQNVEQFRTVEELLERLEGIYGGLIDGVIRFQPSNKIKANEMYKKSLDAIKYMDRKNGGIFIKNYEITDAGKQFGFNIFKQAWFK